MHIHTLRPADLTETTFVPIVKNKSGNLYDSNNYRLILLSQPLFQKSLNLFVDEMQGLLKFM